MGHLQDRLKEQIPDLQARAKKLVLEKGSSVISDVTVSQAYGGMRGVRGFVCDTSNVTTDEGLIIRGHPLLDIIDILPEEVFYLLLTGEIPDAPALEDLSAQFKEKQNVPDYVWNVLGAMPANSHPMTMLTTGIMVMQEGSEFKKQYNAGIKKSDYWEPILEDGISLIAKLPALAAGIYRMHFEKGDRIEHNPELDWASNFAYMTGLDDPDGDFQKLMRLYLMVHCDHEGGNVSAFAAHTVASALSDPFYSVASGLNGLAGPLHGLANQECLKFVLGVNDHFGKVPQKAEMAEYCWDWLNSGRVVPGYGHAVLRCPDPRFVSFLDFGKKHINNDNIFSIVELLYEIVPKVLRDQGKAKNPWPNVDAASGSLLYYYGLTEFKFYTVLFSISRAMGMIAQMVINRALGVPITRPKSVTTDWLEKNS